MKRLYENMEDTMRKIANAHNGEKMKTLKSLRVYLASTVGKLVGEEEVSGYNRLVQLAVKVHKKTSWLKQGRQHTDTINRI
jgi:hypothetical protein